ncbi:hypothetical protein DRN72_00365 [Methanosarcinales archaeon]|nr:MAG: hypothetical protein DRN72_00365 [Methanosarcinales archaeon]
MTTYTTEIQCPICEKVLKLRWEEENIPFFGDIMYISGSCECGFRYTDVMFLESKGASRYTFDVLGEDDLNVRVVRSASGTVRIPELGVSIEPGPDAESFVSNVEGVLERVRSVVEMMERWCEEEGDQKRVERCRELIKMIDEIEEGKRNVRLIIEDPYGNSAIISERAIYEPLTDEEREALSKGPKALFNNGESETA